MNQYDSIIKQVPSFVISVLFSIRKIFYSVVFAKIDKNAEIRKFFFIFWSLLERLFGVKLLAFILNLIPLKSKLNKMVNLIFK